MDSLISFLSTPRTPLFYTLLAIGFVGIFVLMGIRRGVFKELFNILSLVGAYFLSAPLGKLLEPHMPATIPVFLQNMIAVSIAGLGAYVFLVVFFMVLTHTLDLNRKWQGKKKTFVRIGGAIVGGAFGVFSAMLIVWYALTVGTLTNIESVTSGTTHGTSHGIIEISNQIIGAHKDALEESSISAVVKVANPVPQEITQTIETMTTVVQNPQAMQKVIEAPEIQNIMQQEAIQEVLVDEEVRKLAEQGDVMGLLNNPSIQEAMQDPAVQEAMSALDVEALMELLK